MIESVPSTAPGSEVSMSRSLKCPSLFLVPLMSVCLLTGCLRKLPPAGDPGEGTYKRVMDIRVDHFRRSYLVHLPPGEQAGEPLPLVVVIHGAFDTGKKMEKLSGWSRIADREGFIALYPNGMGLGSLLRHWNSGHCCGRARSIGVDDLAFIETVIAEVRQRFSVDSQRIYIVGFSNGGMLTHHVAAHDSGLFAAAAVVSGAIGGRPTADEDVWQIPQPEHPVPMMLIHGRADEIIPFEGGDEERSKEGLTYLSVDEAARFWAVANGTAPEPDEAMLYDGRVLFSRWGGENAAPVVLYSIDGWEHVWPGSATIKTKNDPELAGFDAAELIWDFFSTQTR
jgi:polyhydroxybutyrate depolymerase